MIFCAPSATNVEATVTGMPTGLTGTIGVRVLDNQGVTTTARTTSGISEYPSGSGFYVALLTAPATAGIYTVLWDTGTLSPGTTASEDMTVGDAGLLSVAVGSGTFTYNSNVTTARDKLRLEIGDTDSTAHLFTDEELAVFLARNGDDVFLSAADACDVLAARFSRDFDFQTDDQRVMRLKRVEYYSALATKLRSRSGGLTSIALTRVDGFSQDVDSDDVAAGANGSGRRNYFTSRDRVL